VKDSDLKETFFAEIDGCPITLHFEENEKENSVIELLGAYYEQLVYEELQKGDN
jgi:hypothetical protein